MTRDQAKRMAVRAIDRIVAAAKDLAEAEGILLGGKRGGKATTTKPPRRQRENVHTSSD